MAKSAIRRHHRQRLIRRWERDHPVPVEQNRSSNELEWRFKEARKYVNTRKSCSCHYCVSSRRLYGNALYARTFQEMRHPIEFD